MSKISHGESKLAATFRSNFQAQKCRHTADLYMFPTAPPDEVVEDERLKRFLKRAVSKDDAPTYLTDSIKKAIRRG